MQVEYIMFEKLKETGAIPGTGGCAHAQGPWNRSRAQTLCRAEVGLQQRLMAASTGWVVTVAPDHRRCLWLVLAVGLRLLTARISALEIYTPKEISMSPGHEGS